MSKYGYEEELKKTKALLDTIDIKQFADWRDTNIHDLMDRLETVMEDSDELNNDLFEGFLFNWMNGIEFCEYLKERYGDGFEAKEITTIAYIFK